MNAELYFDEDPKLVAVIVEAERGAEYRVSPVPGMGTRLFYVEPWSTRLQRRRRNQDDRTLDRLPATWIVRQRLYDMGDAAGMWAQLDADEREMLANAHVVPRMTSQSATCFALRHLGLFVMTGGGFRRTELGDRVLALRVGDRVTYGDGKTIGTFESVARVEGHDHVTVRLDSGTSSVFFRQELRRPESLEDPEASALLQKLSTGARKALHGKLKQPTRKITVELTGQYHLMVIRNCELVLTPLGMRVREQDARERAARTPRQ